MTISRTLTTKEVARLCRVSDATVKRWEDQGLLKSERTNGGHRRFRAEEVARFQKDTNLGVKTCPGDESAQSAATRRRPKRSYASVDLTLPDMSTFPFFQALIAGREEDATNFLISEYLHGKPLSEIFDTTITETMKAIGELWLRGEVSVAQEHLATRAALNAIHKVRATLPIADSNNKMVMCCAIEGDFHELSTHLAQIIFESEGYEVLNFGSNTPLYSFAEEILHHSPSMVCISATILTDVERLCRDYKDFQNKIGKLKIPVIFGGRVFEDSYFKQRFMANGYVKTFTELRIAITDSALVKID